MRSVSLPASSAINCSRIRPQSLERMGEKSPESSERNVEKKKEKEEKEEEEGE